MRLFHRKTLNERLLDEAARSRAGPGEGEPEPLGGEPLAAEAVPARRWPVWLTASAPGLEGELVEFVALPDGSLIVDEEQGDASLDPLARAVEARLAPPYRVKATRQDERVWVVCAAPTLVEQLLAEGSEIELVVNEGGRMLTVDGSPSSVPVPELDRIGRGEGSAYTVRAWRLDGDLWEISAGAL